jgi:hypothetical protein
MKFNNLRLSYIIIVYSWYISYYTDIHLKIKFLNFDPIWVSLTENSHKINTCILNCMHKDCRLLSYNTQVSLDYVYFMHVNEAKVNSTDF